jgi:hypothetical protein
MSDDVDRTDEYAEWIAEDQLRESAAGNGFTDHIPPQDEPPEDPYAGTEHQQADDQAGDETAITYRMKLLRINREANRRLDDETRAPIILPPVRNLTTLLDQPDLVTRYRIADVAHADARIMLSAQYKAGKSTLVGNLIRALVDGEPFLGHFAVNTTAAGVVLIDDEMSENTLRAWLRAQNIANTEAVADVICLRGNLGAFNLLDEHCFAAWAQRLHDVGCDYLILDCLRPILDALGLDENRDAGRFLVAFDALLNEAGVRDAALVQHMGHTGERARGDSRFQDWPDAIWRLVREDDDPASARFFTAYGRDVAVPEGRLGFDPVTRRMSYVAGSRGDAKTEAAKLAVIHVLAASAEPLSKNAIEAELGGEHTQKAIRAGTKSAVDDGFVTVTEGPRRAKLHSIAYPCIECGMPVIDQSQRHQSCPSGPEGLFE